MVIFSIYCESNADRVCQWMAGQGSSGPWSASMICQDSQDSAYSCICSYDLLQQKYTKQNPQREKAHEVKARGNQA